jgi:hypothetical protein
MLGSAFGVPARFCNEKCRHDLVSDRLCGFNYGRPVNDNSTCLTREEHSIVAGVCAYCGKPVVEPNKEIA